MRSPLRCRAAPPPSRDVDEPVGGAMRERRGIGVDAADRAAHGENPYLGERRLDTCGAVEESADRAVGELLDQSGLDVGPLARVEDLVGQRLEPAEGVAPPCNPGDGWPNR